MTNYVKLLIHKLCGHREESIFDSTDNFEETYNKKVSVRCIDCLLNNKENKQVVEIKVPPLTLPTNLIIEKRPQSETTEFDYTYEELVALKKDDRHKILMDLLLKYGSIIEAHNHVKNASRKTLQNLYTRCNIVMREVFNTEAPITIDTIYDYKVIRTLKSQDQQKILLILLFKYKSIESVATVIDVSLPTLITKCHSLGINATQANILLGDHIDKKYTLMSMQEYCKMSDTEKREYLIANLSRMSKFELGKKMHAYAGGIYREFYKYKITQNDVLKYLTPICDKLLTNAIEEIKNA